jgi:tetratricopeptide (TPR) repeat protein
MEYTINFMKENKSSPPRISLKQKIMLVLFGLSLFFLLLEVGLRFGGFIVLSLQDYRNRLSLSHTGNYKILCLGESTTQGKYPPFLEKILNQRNIKLKFSVIDKGLAATNTSAILSRVESYLDAYHPDMVVAMMGIGDWGAYMPYEHPPFSMTMRFLRSFKIYKLSQLLWLHMAKKAQEIKFLPLKQSGSSFSTYKPNALTVGLKEALVEQTHDANLEYTLKESLKLNPADDRACFELGRLYHDQGQLLQAEESFKKALELNPKNDRAYVWLVRLYHDQGQLLKAEESFKKALELNPKNDGAYVWLGRLYHDQRQRPQAEESFKKALELNPKNDGAYVWLGRLYHDQGQLLQAKECLEKALAFNLSSSKLYGVLAVIYEATGQVARAQEYHDKANELGLSWYKLMTVNNYHMLKETLNRRKIQLVCVQYPMRSIEPLKKIFEDNTDGIIFVDNEKTFKEAVSNSSYKEYFSDMFGGDFGHCTRKGNQLLAENIANVILKEVFGK